MLAIFQRGQRHLQEGLPEQDSLPPDAVWIDLLHPAPDEIRQVQRATGCELPTREEMREIEASARVYEERGALYLTATVLVHGDSPAPETTEITFVLAGDRLITLRYADPQPFRAMRSRLGRHGPTLTSGMAVLLWLGDGIVGRIADVIERASQDIAGLSQAIFGAARLRSGDERPDLVQAIERIGRAGDTASKIRESLHTLQRVMLAVGVAENLPAAVKKEARQKVKALNRDIQSLNDQTVFLSQKISLLLDATLGMINIEQTNIIKIFSVLAIVFLPPTLIASIYGMNFDAMPELHWRLGYPLSLLLMVASAIVPFLYFKRRGWL